MQQYRSNGKLLITGEYAVLNGAKSLAVPTRLGQQMEVSEGEENKIFWTSLDEYKNIWFEVEFTIDDGEFNPMINRDNSAQPEVTARLQQLFKSAFKANAEAFTDKGYIVTTQLDFNRKWGLGTSSTLVNNLAQWLHINPYRLLEESFGGSGYDIAVAGSNLPVTYQLTTNGPAAFTADFDPAFKDELFFVYLNRKQNSREAIAHYKNQPLDNIHDLTEKISGITEQIISCGNIEEFRMLLNAHEVLISRAINLPRIKTTLFPDFPGLIKSLGGWGGDFILASGRDEEKQYFREKGYSTIFEYSELIK